MSIFLAPCPWCDNELERNERRHNPYARCATPACKGGQLPLLNLDSQEDIDSWNARPVPTKMSAMIGSGHAAAKEREAGFAVGCSSHLDQLAAPDHHFIAQQIQGLDDKQRSVSRVEYYGLNFINEPTAQPNGGVIALWEGERVRAMAVTLRDSFNRTKCITLHQPQRKWLGRVFVDMDGVLVDFDGYARLHGMSSDEVKQHQGAYLDMLPIPGAIEAVRALIDMGFEVWIATKPPTGVPHAYSDKVAWILQYLPELKRRIIVTHHKGLLGGEADHLCDDRPHKAGCEEFRGTLLRFINGFHWPQALAYFRAVRDAGLAVNHLAEDALES